MAERLATSEVAQTTAQMLSGMSAEMAATCRSVEVTEYADTDDGMIMDFKMSLLALHEQVGRFIRGTDVIAYRRRVHGREAR